MKSLLQRLELRRIGLLPKMLRPRVLRWSTPGRWLAGAPLLLALLLLGGCNSWPRFFKYRLTLNVSVDGVVKSGTVVNELSISFNDGIFAGMGNAFTPGCRGDAVVVDLGDKGLLFVLLTGDETRKNKGGYYMNDHPPVDFVGSNIPNWSDRRQKDAQNIDTLAKRRGAVRVEPRYLPLMVRFRDINNPATVERVDPTDLAKTYGPGVRIDSALLEITGDAPTRGIAKRMPEWFGRYQKERGRALDGNIGHKLYSDRSVAANIDTGDFSRGY